MGLKARGAGVALALALGTSVAVVPTATAEEAAPCESEFLALEDATLAAWYSPKRGSMDRQGLLDKIAAAQAKVVLGKLDDAVAKISDYDGKVTTLEGSDKIASEADLHELAAVVVSCIESLR